MSEEDPKEIRRFGTFITIPFVLSVPPVLGWLIGDFLDKKLGTYPWLMYIFVFLGFFAGFREMYRIIKRYGDE